MARPKRFELLTPRFVVWCSIQLSYGRAPGIARGSGPHWQGLNNSPNRTSQRLFPNVFANCSGLKPTRSLPSTSSTGRLIIEGCAVIKAIAFFSLNPS